jgi:hypothetical protein
MKEEIFLKQYKILIKMVVSLVKKTLSLQKLNYRFREENMLVKKQEKHFIIKAQKLKE